VLHRQAATEIVLARYEDAAATLAALRRLAQFDAARSPWLIDMAGRADALGRPGLRRRGEAAFVCRFGRKELQQAAAFDGQRVAVEGG